MHSLCTNGSWLTRSRRIGFVFAALAVVVAGLVPASTASAVAFSNPTAISPTGVSAEYPAVAIGPDGTAVSVWILHDSADIVQQATRRPGETSFSAPETISDLNGSAGDPTVSVGADGVVTVAWLDYYGQNANVSVATRAAGASTFGMPQTISEANVRNYAPNLAANSTGETVVLWTRTVTNLVDRVISQATRPANSTIFGSYSDVGIPGGASQWDARGVFGADGALTVAWWAGSEVWVADRASGTSTFSIPVPIGSLSAGASSVDIAEGAGGLAVVTWSALSGGVNRVYSATRQVGATTFDIAVEMAPTTTNASSPEVVVAPDGTITMAYSSASTQNGPTIVLAATRLPGSSSFDQPVALSTFAGWNPHTLLALDGTVSVVWDCEDGGGQGLIQRSTRSPGSANFSVPETVSNALRYSFSNAAAVGGDGSTVVLFRAWSGNQFIWETLVAGVPLIGEVSPATGPTIGGTVITITGFNFTDGVSVTVGGSPCVPVLFVDPQTITCETPIGSAGSVDVVVSTVDQQQAVAIGAFTFQSPSPPTTSVTTTTTQLFEPTTSTTSVNGERIVPAFTG